MNMWIFKLWASCMGVFLVAVACEVGVQDARSWPQYVEPAPESTMVVGDVVMHHAPRHVRPQPSPAVSCEMKALSGCGTVWTTDRLEIDVECVNEAYRDCLAGIVVVPFHRNVDWRGRVDGLEVQP